MMRGSVAGYTAFPGGAGSQAYNETAFRHFLDIERRRAERSMGSILLILVKLRRDRSADARLADATAAGVFRGLGESVREVDFVGWFREGRIAAAVLAQSADADTEKTGQLMVDRVTRAVRDRLPANQAQRLSVRVVPLGAAVSRWNAPSVRALSGY